jgi:tRNA-specific 2-thiouridylase
MKGAGRVAVAMSGGVDSSVAAALLKEQGYDVFGVSLRVFDPDSCRQAGERSCCSAEDIRDARRVAAHLDIPFSSWDVRSEFDDQVIRPFAEEYLRGRTPNPCILCNSRIKYRLLLEKVEELGARWLATGHYAGVVGREGAFSLVRSADSAKDQTYFLFEIGAAVLPRILFPLAGMTKEEVRLRAADLGLPVAAKAESQEICFVPGNDYGAFLEGRLPKEAVAPGPVVNAKGRRLGTHRGLIHYTVGQRRGLGIAAGSPLYVTRIDRENNTVVVGGDGDLRRKSFRVCRTTWLEGPRTEEFRAEVKIRNRHPQSPATVLPLGGPDCRVEFDEAQRAVTPGQAAVFYDGDTILGGGWIGDIEAD